MYMMKRGEDGMYHDKSGNSYSFLIGSRAQVMHGTAYKTVGNLLKQDLMKSKSSGKYVSKARSHIAKKENRLGKAGFVTRKGHFGAVEKKPSRSSSRSSSRSRPSRKRFLGVFK
jgi:hypothetical protein